MFNKKEKNIIINQYVDDEDNKSFVVKLGDEEIVKNISKSRATTIEETLIDILKYVGYDVNILNEETLPESMKDPNYNDGLNRQMMSAHDAMMSWMRGIKIQKRLSTSDFWEDIPTYGNSLDHFKEEYNHQYRTKFEEK